MKSSKRLLARLLALAVVIGIAVCMFIIGRGHTIYFDNKSLTGTDGTEYKAFYRIDVYQGDTRVAKLSEGDRGMVSIMGQKAKFTFHITPTKDGKKVGSAVTFEVPYSMDGVIYNLPALFNGAAEEVYMEEFIAKEPEPEEEPEDGTDISMDEFEMPSEG